jgi:hypothetical protein
MKFNGLRHGSLPYVSFAEGIARFGAIVNPVFVLAMFSLSR